MICPVSHGAPDLLVPLGGALAGILQWLILRRQVSQAGWWVLASTLGCAATPVLPLVPVFFGGPRGGPFYTFWVFFGYGPVAGALTGIALLWLLRQPAKEA